MFEFKCISRQAFEENPHYIVFFEGVFVVTIWQIVRESDLRRTWGFVGSADFLKYPNEFDTVQEALDFIKRNWKPSPS